MTAPSLAELVAAGDLDRLVAEVDRRVGRADWDGVITLRQRCLEASEATGRQLWGAAQYAAYRLALEAPAPLAASVVTPGAAPFALGPLTEVVAQHHPWADLAPHLDVPVVAATVAHERVVRGEDLTGDPPPATDLDLPLVLQPWEPAYPVPEYRADELLENGPAPLTGGADTDAPPGAPIAMPRLERALRELVAPWEDRSTGEVHVVAVAGGADGAVAALLPSRARLIPLAVPEAFARMAWAGASGGAHGRRRGLAAGRSAAWWIGRLATGCPVDVDPDELEFELEELRWCAFEAGTAADVGAGPDPAGWHLRLAIEHPDGWAVAVDAVDTPRVAG